MESPLRRRIKADYTALNRNVFNCFLKAGSVKLELLSSFVNEFQKVGPETANIREPNLTVLERGTTRSPCAADRRDRRPAMSAAALSISDRYGGAVPRRHL